MSFCFFLCVFCGKQKVPVDIVDLKVFEPVEKLPNMELKAGGTSSTSCFLDQFNLTKTCLFTCGKVAKKGVKLSSARDLKMALVCYREA